MWDLYMSRVMQPGDTRLSQAPFANGDIQFIVHRHKLRVARSFTNAVDRSRELRVPLYVVQALDEPVRASDQFKLTTEVRGELLRRVNPEQTKGLPSFLPLHVGIWISVFSQGLCVRCFDEGLSSCAPTHCVCGG